MNVLLLGSGGRECAIAWKLHQSPLLSKLFIAPGNAGTSVYGENISINPLDFETVKKICIEQDIKILIPGNEDPLVAGIYDFVKNDETLKHIIVVGPSKDGAQLEGSKAFSKEFMKRHQIPTAAYREFNAANYEEGIKYIQNHTLPIVIKADGLAAGKGVVICETVKEALDSYKEMIHDKLFGEASSKVVIEEFLYGIEVSFFALTDGSTYHLLPHAKDYKRILEGDKGPNTGGMGAVSPVPFVTDEFQNKVIKKIIEPTIQGLIHENIMYRGFIFFGLINVDNEPFVIEYNCRLGDPETEVILARIENDFLDVLASVENPSDFTMKQISIHPKSCATVILVSQGYPGNYEKGHQISGLENTYSNSLIFHAGTKAAEDGVITNGGRVLAITSLGDNLQQALDHSYDTISHIDFHGKTYRNDIGYEFKK